MIRNKSVALSWTNDSGHTYKGWRQHSDTLSPGEEDRPSAEVVDSYLKTIDDDFLRVFETRIGAVPRESFGRNFMVDFSTNEPLTLDNILVEFARQGST